MPVDLQAEADVAQHRELGEGAVLLEDHAAIDAPAPDRPAAHQDLAARGRIDLLEAGQEIQGRRLAAPGRTDDGDELAAAGEVLDRKVSPLRACTRAVPGLENLADVGEFRDQGLSRPVLGLGTAPPDYREPTDVSAEKPAAYCPASGPGRPVHSRLQVGEEEPLQPGPRAGR